MIFKLKYGFDTFSTKSTLTVVSGVALILTGICLGLYYGVYVCLIGGIVELINIVKSVSPIDNSKFCIILLKIILFQIEGILAGAIPFISGFVLLNY